MMLHVPWHYKVVELTLLKGERFRCTLMLKSKMRRVKSVPRLKFETRLGEALDALEVPA